MLKLIPNNYTQLFPIKNLKMGSGKVFSTGNWKRTDWLSVLELSEYWRFSVAQSTVTSIENTDYRNFQKHTKDTRRERWLK